MHSVAIHYTSMMLPAAICSHLTVSSLPKCNLNSFNFQFDSPSIGGVRSAYKYNFITVMLTELFYSQPFDNLIMHIISLKQISYHALLSRTLMIIYNLNDKSVNSI